MEQGVHVEGSFDHQARLRTVVDEALLEAEGAEELQIRRRTKYRSAQSLPR